MIVSIHQPIYLPWIPYFGKIFSSDAFVFLDDVQYPMGKGFFNRNIIKGSDGPIMLTAPIAKNSKGGLIQNTSFELNSVWKKKHWQTILLNYKKTPYFGKYSESLEALYLQNSSENFCDFNYDLIVFICNVLNANTTFSKSSDLESKIITGADKLLNIVKSMNGDQYLTGRGAGSMRYMDEALYNQSGIKILWHNYLQAEYAQIKGTFLPDCCILDLLFNCGPKAKDILIGSSDIIS